MPYRQWTSGQLVTAPDFQSYIQDQTILKFASASARDAGITTPTDGMVCLLTDLQQVQLRTGGIWAPIAGKMPAWYTALSANTANFTANSWTEVPWTSSTPTGFNDGTSYVTRNGSRIQVLKAGVYRVEAMIALGGNVIPFAQVAITAGAAPNPPGIQSMLSASSGPVGSLFTSTNVGGYAANDFISLMANPSVAAYAQSGSHISVIYQGP